METTGTVKFENKTIKGLIQETKEYDKFLRLKGQRDVNINKVKLLKAEADLKALQKGEYPFIYPIIINENREICDGQHRFKICKDYDCKVQFKVVIGADSNIFRKINKVNNVVTTADYIKSYAEEGNEIYKFIVTAHESYVKKHNSKINLEAMMVLGVEKIVSPTNIKNNNLKVVTANFKRNFNHNFNWMMVIDLKIREITGTKALTKYEVCALCKLKKLYHFNKDIFIEQFDRNKGLYNRYNTTNDCLALFINMYNLGLQSSKRVKNIEMV